MKKITIFVLIVTFTSLSYAQNKSNKVGFELGKGLNVSLNDGKHIMNIGGYLQADGTYSQISKEPAEGRFGIQRAFFSMKGSYYHDKFGFKFMMDFTDSYPLLDAYMYYQPVSWLRLSAGQRQTLSGTRSMMVLDETLALGNRSLSDRTFFNTGRELGFFVEHRYKLGFFGYDLGLSVTSGDGRNSFGASSTDFDIGGFKYSGRATLYPLGFFTGNNDLIGSDFYQEKSVKIAIGFGYSYNMGVSDKIGEGHGNFMLYDKNGVAAYPDYQKMAADILLKYKGFTFLAEYVNAVASNLDGLHTQAMAGTNLQPREIADYLVLGNGINVQAGYIFKYNIALDARYSLTLPEWKDKTKLINNANEFTLGISKYIIDNRAKIQLLGNYRTVPKNDAIKDLWSVQALLHVVF